VSEYQPTESLQKSEISRRALLRPNAIDQGATAESYDVNVVDLSKEMPTYKIVFSQFQDLKMICRPALQVYYSTAPLSGGGIDHTVASQNKRFITHQLEKLIIGYKIIHSAHVQRQQQAQELVVVLC
jgi:hypothetical protein